MLTPAPLPNILPERAIASQFDRPLPECDRLHMDDEESELYREWRKANVPAREEELPLSKSDCT